MIINVLFLLLLRLSEQRDWVAMVVVVVPVWIRLVS